MLGVRVEIAAEGRRNVRQLIRRQTRAATKHHVLGGVGHAGKICRALVRTDAVINHGGDHRREGVPDNDDLQAIRECGAQHIRRGRNVVGGRATGCRPGQRQEKNGNEQPGTGCLFLGRHKFEVQTTINLRRSSASLFSHRLNKDETRIFVRRFRRLAPIKSQNIICENPRNLRMGCFIYAEALLQCLRDFELEKIVRAGVRGN